MQKSIMQKSIIVQKFKPLAATPEETHIRELHL